MKTIALAALLALSTLAHADDTMISFVASEAGPHHIAIASTPGTPRIAHTATIINWRGEVSYSAGYEMAFNVDLVAGTRYYILISNATVRGVPTCGEGQVCPPIAIVSRL